MRSFKLFYFIGFFLIQSCFFHSIQAKIYDCFTFFNEWEVLEIRLNELYDYVDKFVIVEAAQSFRGLPKPYNFKAQKYRYEKFADKIIYIELEKLLGESDWGRENFQKNYTLEALKGLDPNDIILFSDVDEIPPGELLPQLIEEIKKHPVIGFQQKMYRHYLNRQTPEQNWIGTIAVRYNYIYCYKRTPSVTLNGLREHICFNGQRKVHNYKPGQKPISQGDWIEVPIIEGGWHFTSMGGFERFRQKVENWTHWQNPSPTTYEAWRGEVIGHILVPIDDTFPKYVQENLDYFTEVGLIDR